MYSIGHLLVRIRSWWQRATEPKGHRRRRLERLLQAEGLSRAAARRAAAAYFRT